MNGENEIVEVDEQDTEEQEQIDVILRAQCASLSARSVIEYLVGKSTVNGSLLLKIEKNSGSGMWCHLWVSAADIQDIVLGNNSIVAKSLHPLWEGRSINTCSFALSALRDLGLVEVNEENTRHHRHVSRMTFARAVEGRIAKHKEAPAKTARKKAKEE